MAIPPGFAEHPAVLNSRCRHHSIDDNQGKSLGIGSSGEMVSQPTGAMASSSGIEDKRGVTLDEKVRFLSQPSSYSHAPRSVTSKETHMSWIFLAGDRVFKLKKAVRYPYLDFSTLAAREFYCREEIRLNCRLAKGVYLGVVALTRSEGGDLLLGGAGEVVDWLVVMRRLPSECMLDELLRGAGVNDVTISDLARVLADFYKDAERPVLPRDATFLRFSGEMVDNRAVLTRPPLTFDRPRIDEILARVDEALRLSRSRLEERVETGHVVDGHGDLRPEHICLTAPIAIFDCLEFNRDLRLVDPFEEMALLDVECTRLGAPRLGVLLVDQVARLLGETVPRDLVALYTVLLAILRARLSLAHLLDPVPREQGKWLPLAKEYLGIAEEALCRM